MVPREKPWPANQPGSKSLEQLRFYQLVPLYKETLTILGRPSDFQAWQYCEALLAAQGGS
jgi:hypothetical protein